MVLKHHNNSNILLLLEVKACECHFLSNVPGQILDANQNSNTLKVLQLQTFMATDLKCIPSKQLGDIVPAALVSKAALKAYERFNWKLQPEDQCVGPLSLSHKAAG